MREKSKQVFTYVQSSPFIPMSTDAFVFDICVPIVCADMVPEESQCNFCCKVCMQCVFAAPLDLRISANRVFCHVLKVCLYNFFLKSIQFHSFKEQRSSLIILCLGRRAGCVSCRSLEDLSHPRVWGHDHCGTVVPFCPLPHWRVSDQIPSVRPRCVQLLMDLSKRERRRPAQSEVDKSLTVRVQKGQLQFS